MKTLLISLIAAVAVCGSVRATTLSENVDPNTILNGNSVACNNGTQTDDNTYFRSFAFANFGVTGDFSLSSVSFAIEEASASLPLTVSIYSGTSVTSLGTLIASSSFNVSAQADTFYTLNLSGVVPFSSGGLVMSVYSPASGALFFIGSNSAGQTAPGYILAPDCGITTPTDIAALGFPSDNIILSVTGTQVPEPGTYALIGVGAVLLLGAVRRRRRSAA
jgi:hypothetical protein